MKEESYDKKQAALEATLELIAENGFHGTPMSQIAKKANISVGVIYHYFTNKNDLINELYLDIQTRLSKETIRDFPDTNTSEAMKEHFTKIAKTVFDYFVKNPKELLFMEQYKNSPLITPENRKHTLKLFETPQSFMKKSIDNNIIKDLPLEMITALVSGALNSLIKLYLVNVIKLEEQDICNAFDAIWDMIKKE